MAPQETGKQRASRIPLDYYKRPDRLTRWKLRLTGVALLATFGWLAVGLLSGKQARRLYSRGPVAAVHAMWDDNCTACHEPFKPISGENWLIPVVGQPHGEASRCETCHAGPAHHASQKAEDTPTCGGCHRDHRGRDASLVRLADSDCTHCHGNLAQHVQAPNPSRPFANTVTRFDKDHPEFRILTDQAPDPGKLTFSHARHMAAGMKLPDGGEIYSLAKITDPADRERYRLPGQKDTDSVQLQCASCHRLDGGDFHVRHGQTSPLPARSRGDAMLPITYENQCAACHPLTFERRDPDDPHSGTLAVRHRLQPREIHDFLEGYYTAQLLKGHDKVFEQYVPRRPLPGKLPAAEQERVDKIIKIIQDKVTVAEKTLFLGKRTCQECHEYVPAPEKDGQPSVAPARIESPAVKAVWFEHAVFDHAAHRAMNCLDCHAGAATSTTNKDVLLPGIQNCLQCHGPSTQVNGQARGGARFDCTECHRYHHGEAPLQGIGSAARGVPEARKMSVQQFLSGGMKHQPSTTPQP